VRLAQVTKIPISAGGFAKDGAAREQFDDTFEDGVNRARDWLPYRLPCGENLTHCEKYDKPMPEPRREAIPMVACFSKRH